MHEKPNLQDAMITDFLQGHYGLQAVEIGFLPKGGDINAAAYRVITKNEGCYFLKLLRGGFDETSVTLPRCLRDQGIRQIIAPIPTISRQFWAHLETFIASLYPFVEGHNAFELALTEPQWVDFGAALRGIHTAVVPAELSSRITHETYSPQWRERAKLLLVRAKQGAFDDPVAVQAAGLMAVKANEILDLIQRAERLGCALQAQGPEFVLCHSDIHAGNLLIDANGSLYIVDWDHPILAPKERDLMFIGGGIGSNWYRPQEEGLFYEGYGRTEVNPVALAYYRFERIVQDIAEWGEQLLFTSKAGNDRGRGLQGFVRWFSPNDVVEMAYKAEKNLPRELK